MDPNRLHLSWDKKQNEQELERITESLQEYFPEEQFLIRLTLTQPQPGRSQADIMFYREDTEEDRKICTIRHIIGSQLSIQNIIAAIRSALQK
ncbi:hypothetical protein A3H22_01155 [Candidatus Peribacteria bacterium RIFCSPLOWO2_12_FULL_55_15]|nr:MAG: hypothetical protein A2789_00825 [Candidatus Peribacteria bacterium RIFCSPHIGHO2_01_FULL_54_22]OGJ62445.1 MAG: hypothetical protein A3D12_01505 [Candidatus Peribacteria bacterium RIFCSPHIGHO2_02_FULL_55_24]OGJ64340.1 MAG: hypothetical protein A3E47_02460 [Candidatus Peribacteria bacterium RIFCSPHIGHO2_12_FULL_54_10]OGJ68768.1 MAG: hypothetical protein A2947_02865 [Candidatus Peribacteria bacterium RIFCSPLOWO2_01_FULL_54_110]OGJ70699.1 MAG: hypothetical protein A3H22_01155 [Candidatus Pe